MYRPSRLCRLGELLRGTFGLEGRYIIYLHNQATILCWPFHVWGMGKHLREDDVFISTSTADAETFSHSFERSRVEVVPFTVSGLKSAYPVPPAAGSFVPFIYAGRVSAQKNLHTLIYAFRCLKDAHPELPWRLTIYGKDDHLGSPNMGMRSSGYGESLQKLTRLLGLEEQVRFMGYVERASLNRVLSRRKHVVVSASLHSDENFGMAQFRAICAGNPAVLTRWGGYADFRERFGGRVLLAPVERTERGPWVDPERLAGLLWRAARVYRNPGRSPGRGAGSGQLSRVPEYYHEARIEERLLAMAVEDVSPGPLLRMTPLARKILRKRALFEKRSLAREKIFESYSDSDARVPFEGYRMARAPRPPIAREDLAYRCLPWVVLEARSIRVRDPHRGDLELRLTPPKSEGSRGLELSDWFGTTRQVDRRTVARLEALGYSHALKTGRPS
jgi:glycosyltransferase involved in cell wall biosynthesis